MVHLQFMKKKIVILSVFLIASVLFSILFQSIHSYEHFSKEGAAKYCHHDYKSDKEITHHHHSLDHCFVCDNSIGNYITPEFHFFQANFETTSLPYFLNLPEIITVFSGSNFSLRGPPQFIV